MDDSGNENIKKLFEFCINGDRIGLADHVITNKCNPKDHYARDSNGQTALHIACQHGHLFVVRSLIEIFGCSAQIRDGSGNLPVHYACQHGHLPIVDYLLHFKDISITQTVFETDSEGSNLLHKACQSGSAPVVRYLQEILCYNSKSGVPRKLNLYFDSIAPYDMSSTKKKPTHDLRIIVKALLAKNKQGDTPLHIACCCGHLAIIKIFKSYLPLMKNFNLALAATRSNYIDLAEYIHRINRYEPFVEIDSESLVGIDFGESSSLFSGNTILTCLKCKKIFKYAMLSLFVCDKCKAELNLYAPNLEVINRMLTKKESLDFKFAFSPPYPGCLQATALSGNEQAFKTIEGNLPNSALVLTTISKDVPSRLQAAAYVRKRLKDKHFLPYDSGTLHSACVSDNVELVKYIMEKINCGPNVLDSHGNTPLHVACEWGSYNVFQLLLECNDLDKSIYNNKNQTPLLLALKYDRYDFCEPFLDIISVIDSQEVPLHVVSSSNHVNVDTLNKFISFSVVNSVDQYGDTPIFNACRSGNLVVVKFLIENGSDPLFVNHLTKETPVHIACRMARPDILEALLAKSSTKINFKENSYKTSPISLAIESCCRKTLLTLLEFCSHDAFNSLLNKRQQTLAHFVCIANDILTTEYLVKHNTNWNAQDIKGVTPLHLACYYNHIEIVKRIFSYCSIITQEKDMFWSPIHIASLYGYVEILDVLLAKGSIDLENLDNFVDKDGNNPLHLACQATSYFPCETVERLLQYCSLTAQNRGKSKTPLHIACESGHFALISLLLNRLRSSNINHLLHDSDLNTVLHVAVENTSSLEVVTAVADIVQPVHKNSQGETPIHIACRNGDLDIVRLLVAKVAEIILTDKGDSYLHFACYGKSLGVLKYLTEKSELDFAKLMCQNSDGNTPLHCACVIGDHDIVCYLMERASEYAQTLNNDGLTPFCCLLSSGHQSIAKNILLSNDFDKTKLVEAENSILHCAIQHLKDPELVFHFVLHIVEKEISDPLKRNSENNTLLHSFLFQVPSWSQFQFRGNLEDKISEMWELLLDIPGVQLCAQNNDGDTSLHILVQLSTYSHFINYDLMLTMYLDRAVSTKVDLVNFKNKNGKTAIQLASQKTTRELIRYGANPEDVSTLYSDILAKSKKDCPLNPSTKIVVLGHSEAGKSTLVEAIKSLDLPETQQNNLVKFTSSTPGINTSNHNSKFLGQITFHDFGGQPEFESANAVFLKTKVSLDYPPLFLVVVDISQTDFAKQILYWFSYIRDNIPVQLAPHVIVTGSHSDYISESDNQRVKKHVDSSKNKIKFCTGLHIADMILLDCRKVASEAMKELSCSIADSQKQLQCSLELDSRCHVLIAYLSQWFKNDCAIKFKAVQRRISNSHSDMNVLPFASQALLSLLKSLHSGGHITLLNPDNLDHCWIVLDDSLLYKKVNGTLFAPTNQEFDLPKLPPNSGVITYEMLKSVFEDSDINLITAYIIHSELGQKIEDPETISLIQSAVVKEPQVDMQVKISSSNTEAANISKLSREEYLFLPSCVKSECPSDVWSNDEDSFCWYMKCKVNQFLNQRFLQVLILRITFSFATVASSHLHRKCNIWKNGIHWSTKQGVEVLVEVIEQNSAVVLLIKFSAGFEMEGVKLRSKVLKKILDTKTDICPNADVIEFLFPLTFNYPVNTQEGPKILISEIAQTVTSCDSFFVLDSKSKPHKLSKLLYFEPVVHGLECLWCEEDQNKEVTTELRAKVLQILKIYKEMAEQSEEVVAMIESSKCLAYEDLRKLIGRYSIFFDRNPFKLASTKEPNLEMYKDYVPLHMKNINPVSSMETQQVPTQLRDKVAQAENRFRSSAYTHQRGGRTQESIQAEHPMDVSVCISQGNVNKSTVATSSAHVFNELQSTQHKVTPVSTLDSNDTLCVDDMETIFRILVKARDKHYYIGKRIGVSDADLNEIENKYKTDDRCLDEILKHRVRRGGLTRSMLCQSLRDELVGRDDVAQEIEDSRNAPPPKRTKYD